MTEKQERLLGRRLREAVELQPEIEIFRRLLLDIGGIQLVAPPGPDPAVPILIGAGFVMAGLVQCEIMKHIRCHENVARVWAQQRSGVIGIGTGYALSHDGLWRQHSWGLRREGILETTVRRTKYFGRLLQGRDANSFAESNFDEAKCKASQVVNAPTKPRRS
jgi:hypothetical protein